MLLSLFVNVRLLIKFNLCSEEEKRFCFVCLLNKNVWQIIIFSQDIDQRKKWKLYEKEIWFLNSRRKGEKSNSFWDRICHNQDSVLQEAIFI